MGRYTNAEVQWFGYTLELYDDASAVDRCQTPCGCGACMHVMARQFDFTTQNHLPVENQYWYQLVTRRVAYKHYDEVPGTGTVGMRRNVRPLPDFARQFSTLLVEGYSCVEH
jgi:hypothetical protein